MAKISRSRYKSYGKSQRFKNRGDSLSTSIDRIRQQRNTQINGLKTLATNEERNAELQIRGLRAKERSEIENMRAINDFENKVTANRASAMEVRATREVQALLGKAKEYEKEEKFWQDFAINHSKKYGELAKGIYDNVQQRQAKKLLAELDPNYAYEAADIWGKATKAIEKNANEEIAASDTKKNPLDPKTKKDIVVSLEPEKDIKNKHYHNKVVQDIKAHRPFFVSLIQRRAKIIDPVTEEEKSLLTRFEAIPTFLSYADSLIDELRLPPDSKAAIEIRNQFGIWGRDIAEVRYNAQQAKDDKKAIDLKVETMASEIKLALEQTDGVKQGELWENVQITNQGLHHIIQGAVYESADNKFGLRTWNPQTTNAAVMEALHPYFKDLPEEDQYEIFDNILNFDPDTGKLVKINGDTVGMLTRSKELQKKLDELNNTAKQQRKKELERKINEDREKKIAPFDAAWKKGVDDGDWTDFNNLKEAYVKTIDTDLFENTAYQTIAYNRLNWNPTDYGEFNTYESALAEVLDGDLDTAMIILANNAGTGEIEDGYVNDKKFEDISKAVKVINSLKGDVGAIDEAAVSIYKESFGKTAFKDGLITESDKEVIRAIKHHLIREIIQDKSDDPAFRIFENARATVKEAFIDGFTNQRGLYAATPAAESNWTPAEVADNGKVITKGGYGTKGKNTTRPAGLNNFVFHNFDNKIDSSVTVTGKTIFDEFFAKQPANQTGGKIESITKDLLRKNIETNLNGPNSILSTDEKNFIASNVFNGKADNRAISSNLKVLITMARKLNTSLTTKEVMDMVISGLARNTEADYSQLEGKTYPMGLDDITKKITGKCSKSNRNNYALCFNELLKLNGVDINKPTSDQILNLYK